MFLDVVDVSLVGLMSRKNIEGSRLRSFFSYSRCAFPVQQLIYLFLGIGGACSVSATIS